MEVEWDIPEELLETKNASDSRQELDFFDLVGCNSRYSSLRMQPDSSLLKSYEKKAFIQLAKLVLRNFGIAENEVRRKLRDPEHMERVYWYLVYLINQRCLTLV